MKEALFISISFLLFTGFNSPASGKVSCNSRMITQNKSIPDSKNPLVIRTFFKKNSDWIIITRKLTASYEMGFKAYVDLLNDKTYEGLTSDRLIKNGIGKYKHGFIFLADSITFSDSENTVICIDLVDNPGKSFRVIPSELWSIENNLSINNMDFIEFYESCDENGVFRGFK